MHQVPPDKLLPAHEHGGVLHAVLTVAPAVHPALLLRAVAVSSSSAPGDSSWQLWRLHQGHCRSSQAVNANSCAVEEMLLLFMMSDGHRCRWGTRLAGQANGYVKQMVANLPEELTGLWTCHFLALKIIHFEMLMDVVWCTTSTGDLPIGGSVAC